MRGEEYPFQRVELLVGSEVLEKLSQTRVLVFGLG